MTKPQNDQVNYAATEPFWAPVFEEDGNAYFLAVDKYVAPSREAALKIVLTNFLDLTLAGIRGFTGCQRIEPGNTPGLPATLSGGIPVIIVAGPLLEEAQQKAEAQTEEGSDG